MKEFKGTKKVYPVEYAGYIYMNDKPFYEGDNVLDLDAFGEEVAWANAKLYEAAPELLEALIDILDAQTNPKRSLASLNSAILGKGKEAINKALGQ